MALSKADVEKYIRKIEGHLNSPHERNLKCLAFAELYKKAGELELAKRYTLAYISTNGNDYRGHKFLGELLEDGQEYQKALESYKRSFAINNDQNDVLLKIVKLYTELQIDPKIAKAWADLASKQMPGNPAIFELQLHLIELENPPDYDELINVIAEELTQRPHDNSVHVKLVEIYMEMNNIEDAYDHCVSVNKTKAFHKNLPWFVFCVGVLERYLQLKETQVKKYSPMSRQNVLQEIYISLLTSYCNLVELNLSQSMLRKSSKSLLRLDQLLYQAINLDNGLNNSTDLSEASEWDVAITEIRAQLYMLAGHLLLRMAKEGYSAWSQALEMATACYITSYRVSEPEMTSSWVAKASNDRNPVMWSTMAASRLSQTGHLIRATLNRYGEEKLNSILLNLCSPQGQEDILTTLYGHNIDFSKLFLSEDESFLTPEFNTPGSLLKYDEVFIAENALNLEVIVWIGLQLYEDSEENEPGIEIVASQLFQGLRMDVQDINQCAADFVCLRDIEAFIYAVIKCCAHEVYEDLDVVYEYYQPKLLPLCLSRSLCIPTQTNWWNAFYTLFTGTVSVSDAGKVKMTVQRGLEQIRTLKNQGMHPKLVVHLATDFGEKSLSLKDAAGYSQWYYSTHWKSFQLRSLHYWNVALSLFEDMKRNKNSGCPKDPLFPHNFSHLEDRDINIYFREACMTLGEAAIEKGDFDQALNLFNRVESPQAAWNEAQVFRHLAGLESSNAGVDDRAFDLYIQYLNEAKERLLLCLQRLEYDKVVRDAVEEELTAVESLMNERKSFYHVDPRKSIDLHQLDFDALKSPVCSDITESGETMGLKENDTRELLATVSEVTLDNGFLREQVSIRDEQVLRLSRQVQDLQSELARYKQNGDVSPASLSFPSERTPSPLDDFESSKVHLETGEKFTRQGTFVNNMVVPTDKCDDPSFFSGLSKSNTPDRIQSALGDEEESEEEIDKDGEDIYFKPVIDLPKQVEFRSGEEDETVIFEERAKLFRFYDGEWKERGLGSLKLLWNNTNGHARILMRREKVLKICANHFLTQDMTLEAGKGSDRSWVWNTLADISDDETKPVQFAAKFETKEIAGNFKAKFIELQLKKALFVPDSPAVSPFAANPLATKPTSDHIKVVLSSNLPYLSSTPNKPTETMVSIKPNFSSYTENGQSAFSGGTFSSNTIGASSNSNGLIVGDNFWNQPQSGFNSMPCFQLNKPSDNGKEPKLSQDSYLVSTSSSHQRNTFSFSFGSESQAPSNDVSGYKGIFGDTSEKDGLSFQDLAASNSGTGTAFTSLGTSGSGFSGFGKPIFSVPDNDIEEEHDPENEANIDFKPIVSLSPVENQVTGEEGEMIKFSERAKLFRFDSANKEWKERGVGEIKLLYDPSSGKSRVVMRREQVHKLCANHFILPSMKLKANTTSNRSWLWHTHADVSDGDPKAEQLAIKFKQEETASEFKKIFEELQSICPTSKACDPDADQDTSTNMSVAPDSQSAAPRSQLNDDLKVQFQPPPGSWSCDSCMVQNSSHSTQCAACQTPKTGFSQPIQQPKFSFAPSSGFSFGSPAPSVSTSSQTNGNAKSGFNSGFTFALPSSSFGSQVPKDKARESDTSMLDVKSGFSFGGGETLPSEFTFGEKKSDKSPFSLPESNSDVRQKTSNASPFQSTQTSDNKNKENAKLDSMISESQDKEQSSNDLPTQPSLMLAFQPAKGSWECDTCLVRNAPEPNVCVACQSPKPGSQLAVTNSGFNFSAGTSLGFGFGASQTNKVSSVGTGFTFTPTYKETVFSFGSPHPSKDSTKGPNFSFVPDNASQHQTQTTGFSFGSSRDGMNKGPMTVFNFGAIDPNNGQNGNTGFSFGPTDAHSSERSSINFVPGSTGSTKETGFSFGGSNASEDLDKTRQDTKSSSLATSTNIEPSSYDDGDTNSEETTESDSEVSDGEESVVKLLTPRSSAEKSTDISAQKPGATGLTIQGNFSSSSTGSDDLKLKFQAPEGAWDCDVCMVRNDKQSNSCVACKSPKPGAEQTNASLNSNTFAFGQSFPKQGGFAFSPLATTQSNVPPSGGFTFGQPLGEGCAFGSSSKENQQSGFSFGVPGSSVSTSLSEDTGNFTFGDSKGEEDTTPAFTTFGLDDSSKDSSSGFVASGQSGFKFSDGQTNQSGFRFGGEPPYEFGKPIDDTTGGNLSLENKKPIERCTKENEDVFKDVPKLEDSTNILSQGTFTFRLDIPKQLTMTSPGNKENPEIEDEGVVFKPIVSLPNQVDVKTGEEDETTLFSSHAKLYRFTKNSWKERGVGEIKVLYDPTLQRGRVIMRRDQVYVLCANHFITKDMELKPQGSSGKSWLWHVQGDFAENEAKEQLFAVKFGDTKTALAFKSAFEQCVDHKVSPLSQDVVEDEVIVLSEVSVTEEQRAQATKFLLPPNFYAYENQNEIASEEKQDHDKSSSVAPAGSERAPQSFVFGSSDITSLSFKGLSSNLGSGFLFTNSSQNKEFPGTGSQLFGQSNNEDDNDPEREVSSIDFNPIVQLEKVEQPSGEEDEIIVYNQRAKLFRYDKDTSQWKERGVGNLKLLKHKISGQIRVLMRRDQIFKVCANHFLTADMELKPNEGSDRSWVWHTNADVSDGESKAEQLAVKFKNAEIAREFKEKFDKCKEELVNRTSSKERDEDVGKDHQHDLNVDAFLSKTGSNTDPCNKDDDNETKQENSASNIETSDSLHEISSEFANNLSQNESERGQLLMDLKPLNFSSTSKTPSEGTQGEQAKGVSSSQRKTTTPSSSSKSPPREILGSIDEPSPGTEPVTRVNFNLHSIVAGKAIYTGLDEEKVDPPEIVRHVDNSEVVKELFPDTEDNKNIGETKQTDSEKDAESSSFVDGGDPVFRFGSSDISSLSFASISKQPSGFSSNSDENKGFLGSGGQLFSSNDEDDPEREVEGTDFKPIVSLLDVIEQKTGEEDETVVYSHRAKLFRYDVDTKQWKERGVGDIKILLHNETKRSRVVMRRDQIHKLCANHYITADMDLKEKAGSDRSWVWLVEADFSDGVAKKELLAVRFKHHEDAVMFRDKFIECQENNELKESEVTSFEEKPSDDDDDDDDDVVIFCEKVPSQEQKERAQLYELPPTFYCFEQNSEDDVEKNCDDSVEENLTRPTQESIPEIDGSIPKQFDSVAAKEEIIPVFQFGSKETSALSFAELAKQTSGFPKTSEGTWKGFLGSGGQLFSSNDEDDPEREVEGTDFKPIVSLPDVIEQKTGEEDETVVYSHRAKLFRYDMDTKQWKERGVGDIKILLHNETKRSRVVMRREQIHKLCANHYITADMDLKKNAGSDRSWMWSVEADFSDGVAKKELLAVRFKHDEDAGMFRDKFIECQEKNELKESEVTSVEEKPSDDDDDDDDVVIFFEKVPSPEQKERAQLYELPPTFYCFEQDLEDDVEKNCDNCVEENLTRQAEESVSENDGSIPENDGCIPGKFDSVAPKEEIIPVFQFGSKETSALSFAELAKQTSGFPKTSEGTWQGFFGSGGQLFSSNDEDDSERDVEGTDFKPIVSLPGVIKQKTGEEDETVVYSHRAKLFRYDVDTKQWKERGVGDIKILLHNETKRSRVVMRRDQIHKLCANHYITADMELKKNAGSDRSWVWSVEADFSDGVAKKELLAVRFKHHEDAVMFRNKFIECQEKNELKESKVTSFKEKPSDDNDDHIVIFFEKVPSQEQKERAQLYELPQTFYCFEQDSEDDVKKNCDDCVEENLTRQTQESFSENADRIPENGGSAPEISDSVAEKEIIPVFQFGSQETFALSFAELAKQTSGFPKTSEGTWKGFLGSGGQLFSSNDEDDPEREVEGTHFKPIVSLPDVIEQKTGEEDETVVYSHRAKLFRYDVDTKQWKERGVGDIKILLHNETKRSRVVMRRDQIHKLCANHYITADMDLKKNQGSDRSWVWSVEADFSDGVAKKELFAVRFKHHEDAVMFRDKFNECQEKNELKESKVISVEEKPSDDDDDVVIFFEKVPSQEQKERAQLYELPQTFYCFEQDSEDDVEKSCDDSVEEYLTRQTQESFSENADRIPENGGSVPEISDSVAEKEEIIPVFQFGSKETSALSFAELAKQTSGFPKTSEGTWKGFLGSGGQLFSSNDEDDPEREVEGTHFKPIVSLPDVIEQKTGEEDETVVYSHRAKLFRYDVDTKQWKERGVGDIKILLHNETKRSRVVMRRDQIHKLCANHYITADMDLKKNQGSDRSWVWSVEADFSDGVAKKELLAVRFKHDEDAVLFRDKFIECQENNELRESKVTSVEEKPSDDDDDDDDDVVIFFEKVPSQEQKERAQLYDLPQTFYCPDETTDKSLLESGNHLHEEKEEQITEIDSKSLKEKDESEGYENYMTGVQSHENSKQPESCVRESSSDKPRYKLNVVDESPSNDESIPTLQDSASTTTYAHSFVFGSQDISSLTFSALAGKTSGFKLSPNMEFPGTGSKLFCQSNNEDDNDPEREASSINFEPIVQLDKVEQSSGEENEIIVYNQRAKLFRYDKDTSQWKERGVGNLKLLKHKICGQIRVLMRRDQIFKVCANHFLTADMELKPNAGSDRSWVWHTNADVSDGESKAEQLAVQFKNAEIAREFKEKFDKCKEELKASPSEKNNLEKEEIADEKPSLYENKLGAVRLTANDPSDNNRASSGTSKKEKLVLPVTTEPFVTVEQEMMDKHERERLQNSERNKKETHHLSSQSPTFYSEYIQHLVKQDVDKTNHDLQILFSREAEVFVFDEQQHDWHERGYGTLQVLRYKSEYHIFMYNHGKVYVAHRINASMDLKPNAGSDRSWVWFTLADHSDVEVVKRELAAEFQSVEHCFEFKKVFDECRDSCGVPHEGHVHAMAASFDSNTRKLPSHHGVILPGASPDSRKLSHTALSLEVTPTLWRICSSCKVENCVANIRCVICGEQFREDLPLVGSIQRPHMKIRPSSARKSKKPIPTPTKHIVERKSTVKQEKDKPVDEWWKCLACNVENNIKNPHCLICSSSKPPEMLSSKILSCCPEITAMLDEISKK